MTTMTSHAMNVPRISFGDRLRRVRINLGLTQDAFGQSIGLSGAAIGKYELMGEDPKMAKVVANSVELRFGIPAEWLLTGVEPTGLRPTGLRPHPIPVPRNGHKHVIYAHEHNHSTLRRVRNEDQWEVAA